MTLTRVILAAAAAAAAAGGAIADDHKTVCTSDSDCSVGVCMCPATEPVVCETCPECTECPTCPTCPTVATSPAKAAINPLAVTVSALGFSWALASDKSRSLAEAAAMECQCVDVNPAAPDDWMTELAKLGKSGMYNPCGKESFYYEHEDEVPLYGGYKGCVGEAGLEPCDQNGFGKLKFNVTEGYGRPTIMKPYEFDMETKTCKATGVTRVTDEHHWIVWGLPGDTRELISRTESHPSLVFPFTRMTYPSGVGGNDHGDDAASARVDAKAMIAHAMEYQDGTDDFLDGFSVGMSEGSEQSTTLTIAAKMMELASGPECIRKFHLFVEAPSYGYDLGYMADLATRLYTPHPNCTAAGATDAEEFYSTLLSLDYGGWVPGTPLPTATGPDGNEYTVASTSPFSPWIESLVFPENPSGVIKAQQGPKARLHCDGCYFYPHYFLETGKIPVESIPQCEMWSFSVTKMYSAAIRTGFYFYNHDNPAFVSALSEVVGDQMSIANGIYSELSWSALQQISEIVTAKPVSDPTSWLGAYKSIMADKWNHLIAGFDGCPYVSLTNPRSGGYGWFKMNEDYVGTNSTSGYMNSFFATVLGTDAPHYGWGFRGASATDYSFGGPTYSNNDFIRLQLFRDVDIYKNLGERAAIACNDPDTAACPHCMTANEWLAWNANELPSSRKLLQEGGTVAGTVEELTETLDEILSSSTARRSLLSVDRRQIAEWHARHAVFHRELALKAEAKCAKKGYSQNCLMQVTGLDAPNF